MVNPEIGEKITTTHIENGIFSAVLKDILPVATALIGFAAGLASAAFGIKSGEERNHTESTTEKITEKKGAPL